MMVICAWMILRISYAGMFLYPLWGLLKDWNGTKSVTALVIPFAIPFFTIMMLCTMFFGALAILFGIYGQVAGLGLLIYCLLGAIVHYRLADNSKKIVSSSTISFKDQQQLTQAIQLAVIGNVTSAQKNFVLAAVACFFMLLGTGPYSMVNENIINLYF